VNYSFCWRRYPAALAAGPVFNKEARCKYKDTGILPRSDIEYALRSMPTFADITEDELATIFQKATQHQRETHLKPVDIQLGHYYIHGRATGRGSVRRVIDEADDSNLIIYKVITGPDRGETVTSTRDALAQWARHEVVFENEQWKITDTSSD